MNDLINGRELLKRLHEDLCYDIACKDCSMCTEDGGCRVEEWIDKFPSADRPQGDVDAVDIFEREMHNLDQGYITIGEFDERIEPLRHLCYDRPQGRWIFDRHDTRGINRCSECGAEIKGYGKNIPFPNCPYCLARMLPKQNNDTCERWAEEGADE